MCDSSEEDLSIYKEKGKGKGKARVVVEREAINSNMYLKPLVYKPNIPNIPNIPKV